MGKRERNLKVKLKKGHWIKERSLEQKLLPVFRIRKRDTLEHFTSFAQHKAHLLTTASLIREEPILIASLIVVTKSFVLTALQVGQRR